MKGMRTNKTNRILKIFTRINNGEAVKKKDLALEFNVSEKAIQRDIDYIRNYLSEDIGLRDEKYLIYDRSNKSYHLTRVENNLNKKDILAIIKILLESRAFCQEELDKLIDSLYKLVGTEDKALIRGIIGNELLHYIPLEHGDLLLNKIWDFSQIVKKQEKLFIEYIRADGKKVEREVKPVSLIFSEYYFYLIAYLDKFDFPAIYRIDRVKSYKKLGERFHIPYANRFEAGEFRKRVQFMYPGELMNPRFEFSNGVLEAVLDRLPTAKLIKQEEGKTTIEAEVFGEGIVMWLLSQGSKIKVLSPAILVRTMREEVRKLGKIYGEE